MAYIVDDFQSKRLKKYNINIKTKYIVLNNILERNTDNSYNDDIKMGIRCEKQYYLNKELKLVEKNFDSRIEYTYLSNELDDKDYTCPNCGVVSKLKDFKDGCPYCKTYYNMDYIDKDLGSKYHYDRVLKSNTYRIITFFVDLFVSTLIMFFYIKYTSRTFNQVDITKVFLYGFILSLILYYFFYLLDAYIILTPIKKYKDRINRKQIEFWNKTGLSKKKFYNNLNYEISKYYYQRENIIDYDILDYLDFNTYEKDNNLYIDIVLEIRVVKVENNSIKSTVLKQKFTFKKNDEVLMIKNGINLIKCSNCGASININDGECKYCHSKIKYLSEWILE